MQHEGEQVPHLLHKKIAKCVEEVAGSNFKVVKDVACCGSQRIPLFCDEVRSRDNWLCDVDILIVSDEKVKVIFEIEESNKMPTKICGKFITSALSKYYIHDAENNAIAMDKKVTLIQIVDTKSNNKSGEISPQKKEQLKNIEKAIKNVIPLNTSKINDYHLIYGNTEYFDGGKGYECLKLKIEKAL